MDRNPHWIKANHQERIPSRMVSFDTESRSYRSGDVETQEWRIGAAIRWRTDLATGDHAEVGVFDDPQSLWKWVDEYGRPEKRTVVWAHNLGHDVRISQAMTILPAMGYRLEWCNLDQNVSAMTWRSDHGTIVMADTYTWVPMGLGALAPSVGTPKYEMPKQSASDEVWYVYCLRDAQIVYRIVSALVHFIKTEHLGNWQPTGAGMAYATWRHRFMSDRVLVHNDPGALAAERAAMHTGRAEAWKHGRISGIAWSEVDMRNAYATIGRDCELPRKLHMHTRSINHTQYARLANHYRVLARVHISTRSPASPCRQAGKTLWPIGQWETWLWDTEIDCALRYGAEIKVLETYCYTRAPILRDWAAWILGILNDPDSDVSPIARTWLKHASRALIGRLSLMTRSWSEFGTNPDGITGITHMTDAETGKTRRMLHVGDVTLIESDADETQNSIPMVTSWIMAECRVRLWDAMNVAGLRNVAHVDTDSVLVNPAGLAALRAAGLAGDGLPWKVKGAWLTIDVRGPRHYYRGKARVIAGVPLRAAEARPGTFTGERWASMATDLEARGDGVVTTWHDEWTPRTQDTRRRDDGGYPGETVAYEVGGLSSSNMSDAPSDADGE